MVVFKKVSPIFVIKYSGGMILGLVVIILVTLLVSMFMEFEEITTLLPSIAVFGTVMSLFLAFKTNESYNRWWEARTLWGQLVNYSRSFTRQVLNLITLDLNTSVKSQEERSELQKELIPVKGVLY